MLYDLNGISHGLHDVHIPGTYTDGSIGFDKYQYQTMAECGTKYARRISLYGYFRAAHGYYDACADLFYDLFGLTNSIMLGAFSTNAWWDNRWTAKHSVGIPTNHYYGAVQQTFTEIIATGAIELAAYKICGVNDLFAQIADVGAPTNENYDVTIYDDDGSIGWYESSYGFIWRHDMIVYDFNVTNGLVYIRAR